MGFRRSRKRKIATAAAVLVVLAVGVGGLAWWALLREVPQRLADDSMEERFKYGSIGTEQAAGIPYWIWLVLPTMFPEHLPAAGGYAALGFPWERGREMPVGFTRKTIGFDRVGINCATCHVTSVRREGEAAPRLLLAGPGNTQDLLSYQRFLFACASDPRFTPGNVLAAIGRITELPVHQRLLYRWLLIPQTRKALLAQKEQFAWTDSRPDWGRGRIDPFNPVKVALLKLDPGDTIGNSDMEALWNLRPRVEGGMAFHWDGLQGNVHEVVLSSALGDGATARSLPRADLDGLQEWLMDLPPPRYDALFPVDAGLAAAGAPVFRQHCAACHAFGGAETGKVLPLTEEAWRVPGVEHPGPWFTDPHRARMWTQEAADTYNRQDYAPSTPFRHFRAPGGYVNVPLDGIWARAPYLHNGSVPYLDELLEVPERRTPLFWRGYDLYDPQRVGFVASGPGAERAGSRFDVREPGNSNQGHLWGVNLPAEDKRALVEFLKTL
ncbi:MAG TPA: cytochrome c [Thermoanaerobaculia bacterium]|nr:cytochrome c [Thermoanaerobaculia bacterium]